MRNLVATFFRLIQIVLLPIGAVGYLLFVFKLVTFSRRSGTSATVLASLYTRYMQHRLGTRCDKPCDRLMMVLPNVSHLGLCLATTPTLLAHRLTRYVPRIYRYPYEGIPPMKHQPAARTTFYDAALERHIAGISQLVILGAGFDTRAYRLPAATRVRCFEVDTPRTQAFKREMLKKAGVDTTRVTYVPADFLEEDWLEKLVAAGLEPARLLPLGVCDDVPGPGGGREYPAQNRRNRRRQRGCVRLLLERNHRVASALHALRKSLDQSHWRAMEVRYRQHSPGKRAGCRIR